ncbi:centrosomal protein of 57 kDa-like [Brachionichthys hirsutus]|uniref:centrosomal protein of 57 kDa-like n=1 Tax=Brachionichthys hirsutus TaxID=412623 RepID=UPI0036053A7B
MSKTPMTDRTREKDPCPPPAPSGIVSDSASYKEYPASAHHVKTLVQHHAPHVYAHESCYPSKPSKAFPETSSGAILSALRNLQEKIRKLELEKGRAELSLRATGNDASRSFLQRDKAAQRQNDQTGEDARRETSSQSNCNQALVTNLAAAESRCVKLERRLDHMRRMLQSARADRTGLIKQQATESANQQSDPVSERSQLVKLERLEQEHLRLSRTQSHAEMKIRRLEMKLQEEEKQRKLVQDKANQLQTGLEVNRILLQSVSPRSSNRRSKEKRSSSKRSSPQQPPHTQPHYRLNLRDVPFVTGTSVSCSHSVRANVQSVLSLLKQHQPHLCNSRILANVGNDYETGSCRHSDTSSSASGDELSELIQALRGELQLMSLEQDELMRQSEASVSDWERKELQREQERLLMKMERKGEQISKLYKHKTQIKKLRKEANGPNRSKSRDKMRMNATAFTRGRAAGPDQVRPGARSQRNLRLLRDMKALQASLRT